MPYVNEAFRYLVATMHADIEEIVEPQYKLMDFLDKLGIGSAGCGARGPFRNDGDRGALGGASAYECAYVNFMESR
jgi:hypothetical protein